MLGIDLQIAYAEAPRATTSEQKRCMTESSPCENEKKQCVNYVSKTEVARENDCSEEQLTKYGRQSHKLDGDSNDSWT